MTKSLWILVLCLATVGSVAARADDSQIVLEPLTNQTKMESFKVTDAFKVLMAAYKQDIAEVNADTRLTDDEKKVRTDRIKARAAEMLVLHDRVVNLSPVVFAISFYVGAELPLSFTRALIKVGMLSFEGAGGVTFAVSRNRANGKIARVAVGLSSLLGPNLQFGTPPIADRRAGASGFKYFVGAAAIVPMSDALPPLTLGDLQGWYFGGAIEISTDSGIATAAPKTFQLGAYAKPNGFQMPQAGLLFAYRGVGSAERPVSIQLEAMHFGVLAATDGSQWLSPNPFSEGHANSPHNNKKREEELKKLLPSSKDILDRMTTVQGDLDKFGK